MSDEIEVLMCMRVADMAVTPVPSRTDTCLACGSQVWVSLRAPPGMRLMCQRCVTETAKDDDEFGIAEETATEVAEYLAKEGLTDE